MTDLKPISMCSTRCSAIRVNRDCERSRRPARALAAIALAAFILPLAGCSVDGSGGEGTVDISRAKAAASSNPDMAKAAAARGASGIGGAQKGAEKKGRR